MDEIINDYNRLLNDNPIDDANKAQSQGHIEDLIREELNEAKQGFINTNKKLLTIRIKDASTLAIRDKMSRWISLRNDVVLRTNNLTSKGYASEVDAKERSLVEQAEDAKANARENFIQNSNYSTKRSEYEKTKIFYDNLNSEMGGKPPVKKNTFIYLLSILLIGFVEWFINYSTFNLKYPSGIAFGITILVALAIAIASHFHGALIKQRLALFAPYKTSREKRQIVFYQAFFTILLIIALGMVTNARYDVLQDQMATTGGASLPGLQGLENNASSIWDELTPFILMNVLVWLVGVAISFFTHDSRPDYQEAQSDFEKARKRFQAADKGLRDEEKRIEAEFEQKILAVKNLHSSKTNNVTTLGEYLERLTTKEDSLIKQATTSMNDTLERHQSALVAALRQSCLENVKFGPEHISLNEYLSTDIKISVSEVRELLHLESAR